MYLTEQIELLKAKKKNKYAAGTINRIFEIHENNGKDASGFEPLFVKPLEDEKKKKKSLN